MENKLILGVDPGLVATGFALVENSRVFYHKTIEGKLAVDHLIKMIKTYDFSRAVVEKPKQSVLYQKHLYGLKSYKGPASDAMKFKICMDIGKNILISDMIIDVLKLYGIKVRPENPASGETKWAAEFWRKKFSFEGRLPSEHARDAAVRAMLNEKWYGWELTQEQIDIDYDGKKKRK